MADRSSVPPSARKPLSMLWVLAAVGCFVVIHTLVNLAYRKPDRPHEPVAEARERQRRFVQADMKGWTRIAAHLAPVAAADPVDHPAAITREPAPEELVAALPFDLVGIFTTDPRLHRAPGSITAPASVPPHAALRLVLNFKAGEKSPDFGEALAFAKDNHLYLFLQDETRTVLDEPPIAFAPALELTLPPDVLAAGDWQVSLYTQDAMFSWRFSIPDGAPP